MSTCRPRLHLPRVQPIGIFLLLTLCVCLARTAYTAEDNADTLPPNLDQGLRQLVTWNQTQPRILSAPERRARLAQALPGRSRRAQTDADAVRAVVRVTLNDSRPWPELRADLQTLGLEILAADVPRHGQTTVSARLPLDQAGRAACLPGVRSITLAHRPWRRVGRVTTLGAFTLNADSLSSGSDGAGISVGVLSDSFDVATHNLAGDPLRVRAATDITGGDLPGPGNPLGHLVPVRVLAEGDPTLTEYNVDEGRALLQIVHDLAPGASLAFATAGLTPEVFADHIRALRANPDTRCDVLVDDVTFPDEPMFSDGPAARAVYEVTHDGDKPGRGALYYAAAGNNGDYGYAADFNPVADAQTRAGASKGNLKLDQVPGELTAAGFHNFDTRPGKVMIAQRVKVKDVEAEVDFQWDDSVGHPEFGASDYNLLVFDAAGNFLGDLSGKDRNGELGNALELVDLPAGDDGGTATYQLAIACASQSEGGGNRLRYVVNTNGEFHARFTGHNAPTIFGHAAAVGADAVATYTCPVLSRTPARYSSLGPVTICFDRDGRRQPPEIRQQPTVAAVDGVNNSFFGQDTDGDGFPNFYGTSAAAPHAAACAALLLQAAGGPGSLTNQQARALLQGSASAHDLDPNTRPLSAMSKDGRSTVTLAEVRDDIDAAGTKKFFRLSFTGPADVRLSRIVITLNQSAMTFDDSATGAPFAVGEVGGGLQKSDVTAGIGSTYSGESAAKYRNQLTVTFAPGKFGPGESVAFGLGIDKLRDFRGYDPIQWAMIGTNFTAKLTGPDSKTSAKSADAGSNWTTAYSPFDGAGLIDLGKALGSLVTNGPPLTPDSRVALTPGNLLLTTDDGRVVETTPKGAIVQSFDVPEARASAVLANGKVAVLCAVPFSEVPPHLTILDPLTGESSVASYPAWKTPDYDHSGNQIVSQGNYVFVLDSAAEKVGGGTVSKILRYDTVNKVWQSFGEAATAYSQPSYYHTLYSGLDGRIYATIYQTLIQTTPTEIYDPETLQLTGTAPPLLTVYEFYGASALLPATATDTGGNVYRLGQVLIGSSFEITVLKKAPGGATLATLDPRLWDVYNRPYTSAGLKVDAEGRVYITVTDGFLVVNSAFSKVTQYTVFKRLNSSPASTISALTLVGP